MADQKKMSKRKMVTGTSLPLVVLDALDELATETRMSNSKLLRIAAIEYLGRRGKLEEDITKQLLDEEEAEEDEAESGAA
jgi:metal-responsive CopG/Arc/MetJ family transcriptional regulator